MMLIGITDEFKDHTYMLNAHERLRLPSLWGRVSKKPTTLSVYSWRSCLLIFFFVVNQEKVHLHHKLSLQVT